jgi:hypothetical protein
MRPGTWLCKTLAAKHHNQHDAAQPRQGFYRSAPETPGIKDRPLCCARYGHADVISLFMVKEWSKTGAETDTKHSGLQFVMRPTY